MDRTRRLQIPVSDLRCGAAGARTVERELPATDNVLRVYVNPATETAYLDHGPSETDPWALAPGVEHAGYRAGRPTGA